MKIQDTLRELETVADKKGIKVTYEALGEGATSGGLCKVKGEWRIIVDKKASTGERLTVIAHALAGFPLDDVYLSPEVRETIEKAASFRRG